MLLSAFCFAYKGECQDNSCFSWGKIGNGCSGFHQFAASDPSIHLSEIHPASIDNFRESSCPTLKSAKAATYSSLGSQLTSAWERQVLPRCQHRLATFSGRSAAGPGLQLPQPGSWVEVINGGKSPKVLLRILFQSDGRVQTPHHFCLGFIRDPK